jgi:hypothetical protein
MAVRIRSRTRIEGLGRRPGDALVLPCELDENRPIAVTKLEAAPKKG